MRSYLQESKEMSALIIAFIKERKDLPQSLLKDLIWLIGKQVCQLIKPMEPTNVREVV